MDYSIYIYVYDPHTHTYRWWKGKILLDEEKQDDLTLASVRNRVLYEGAPAPHIIDVKDFLRFYAKQSKGRINKHSSVESTVSQAEFFFAGFTMVTGTPTIEDERSEVYRVHPNIPLVTCPPS